MSSKTPTQTISPRAASTSWRIDPDHTSAEYAIRHMFTSFRGVVRGAEGRIEWDPRHPERAVVEASVDPATIDTGLAARDEHLKGPDFFDVARFSRLTFRARGLERVEGDRYRMAGELTMRGVTRPVVFEVTWEGEGPDAWGAWRAGATATATVDRKDFGMTWNAALDHGGIVLGDAVRLTLHVEAIREG